EYKEGQPTAIRMGLAVIKNVSHGAVAEILKIREEGNFIDFADFVRRVCGGEGGQAISKTAVECLVKAGCFDNLPGHRAQLLAALREHARAASQTRRER